MAIDSTVIVALIMATSGGAAGLWAWIKSRRKDKVEVEAQRQVALGERFDDATQLDEYVQKRIDRAIEPLQKQIDDLKKDSHEIHDAVRLFFTDLWTWDFKGRPGPMPLFPTMLLTKLRLEHLRTDAANKEEV